MPAHTHTCITAHTVDLTQIQHAQTRNENAGLKKEAPIALRMGLLLWEYAA